MLGTLDNPSYEQRPTKRAWKKTAMRRRHKAQRLADRLRRALVKSRK